MGLCALWLAIALPLRHLAGGLVSTGWILEGGLGVVTIALGSWIAVSAFVARQ